MLNCSGFCSQEECAPWQGETGLSGLSAMFCRQRVIRQTVKRAFILGHASPQAPCISRLLQASMLILNSAASCACCALACCFCSQRSKMIELPRLNACLAVNPPASLLSKAY